MTVLIEGGDDDSGVTLIKCDASRFVAENHSHLSFALAMTDSTRNVHSFSLNVSRADRLLVSPSTLIERVSSGDNASRGTRAFARGALSLVEKIADSRDLAFQVVDENGQPVDGVKVTAASVKRFGKEAILVDLVAEHQFQGMKNVRVQWLGPKGTELATTPLILRGKSH